MAITSLVLGIICLLALFDDSDWDTDQITGLGMFAVIALVFGIISVSKKKPGNTMTIIGIVLSAVSLVCFIGLSN
jgi:hypothetical protein